MTSQRARNYAADRIDLPTATAKVRATSHPSGTLIDIAKAILAGLSDERPLRRLMLIIAAANLTVALERTKP